MNDEKCDQAQIVSAAPQVSVSYHVHREAVCLAEQAADEINRQLQAAEEERDRLVRRTGVQQALIDKLLAERDLRTAHVRALLGARDR
jgi:hypothetical protein